MRERETECNYMLMMNPRLQACPGLAVPCPVEQSTLESDVISVRS